MTATTNMTRPIRRTSRRGVRQGWRGIRQAQNQHTMMQQGRKYGQ